MQTNDLSTRTRRVSRRRGIAFAALVAIAALVGVGALAVRARLDPGEPVMGVRTIAVRDDEFAPAAIEVPAGTTVTWRWEGNAEHNVVGDGF
jgi:plastocyanin